MTDSNVFNLNKPEPNDPLQEILREGARKMLIAAIDSEIVAFIQQLEGLKTDEGKAAVVRNGICLRALFKRVLVALKSKCRKFGITLVQSTKFNSSLIPPYLKRTKNIEEFGSM